MGSAVCHQAQTANDPFVRKMLGDESPEELAHRLVSGPRSKTLKFARTCITVDRVLSKHPTIH